uniref:F-box domain-containing protein n=1 Tax=Oryza barthii TaxID=65489 RepID=A0A0D3HAR2_9ORYZ
MLLRSGRRLAGGGGGGSGSAPRGSPPGGGSPPNSPRRSSCRPRPSGSSPTSSLGQIRSPPHRRGRREPPCPSPVPATATSGAAVAGLPIPEEIQEDILLRLPANSVLRCSAVCRSWRRIASTHAFLLRHHRRQPELPLVTSFRNPAPADQCTPNCLDAILLRSAERRPIFSFPRPFCGRFPITASCDGLFIVRGYICNPTTRQCAPISTWMIDNLAGLYRHEPSGEYRVLYWKPSDTHYAKYCLNDYCVLTVCSNKPRRIPCSVTLVDEEIISGMGPAIFGTPVLLHGNLHLHWKKRWGTRYNRILVFDTVAESFRQLRPPAVNPRNYTRLLAMDGMLAMSVSKERVMDMSIFMLEDYDHEVWAFRYKIKLTTMEIRRFQDQGDWWADVVSEEGDILVSCFGWLLHCDKKGNLVSKFQYNDDLPAITPHRIKESLVQHAFFKR